MPEPLRPGPLAHVRVLDLSRLYPGALCTLVLADLGADVLKVEAPGAGDGLRHVYGPTAFPAAPLALASGRLENRTSNAWAIASGSGAVTSPVSSSVTNSGGPPASVRVTTGRRAAKASIVT